MTIKKIILKFYSFLIKFKKYLVSQSLKLISNIFQLFFLRFNKSGLENEIEINRSNLKKIDTFIDIDDYNSSSDNYGLPKYILKFIDKELGSYPTYSDLQLFLAKNINKKITYVEIGVSVLKNFYQMLSGTSENYFFAFDRNAINKNIAKNFKLAKSENNVIQYTYNKNKITYFIGDVFDLNNLQEFRKIVNKANFIFSDAHHSYDGLISEYNFLIKYILDDDFILYYDDLKGELSNAFFEIKNCINTDFPNYENIYAYTFLINGWMGRNEKMHRNGIISNIDIELILKKEKIKLFNFKKI